MRKVLALSLVLPTMVACESVDSEAVMTSGVYADIVIQTQGEGSSDVATILRVGGPTSNTYLDLMGEDTLTATVGEETLELEKQSLGDYREYTAGFDVDAEDTLFDVSFTRAVDAGAPSSTVTMPAPFALTGPEEGAQFVVQADDITVTYEPASTDDQIRWTIEGDCIYSEGETVTGDPGSFVIPADLIEVMDEEDASCSAELKVIRARAGSLDAGYGEGGEIEARQVRSVEINVSM
ncbi:MAG: hypothetical protein VX899_14230 [Myxococcota bacterium]|nr:hypothetical protein [Myxococcota bacterium]